MLESSLVWAAGKKAGCETEPHYCFKRSGEGWEPRGHHWLHVKQHVRSGDSGQMLDGEDQLRNIKSTL